MSQMKEKSHRGAGSCQSSRSPAVLRPSLPLPPASNVGLPRDVSLRFTHIWFGTQRDAENLFLFQPEPILGALLPVRSSVHRWCLKTALEVLIIQLQTGPWRKRLSSELNWLIWAQLRSTRLKWNKILSADINNWPRCCREDRSRAEQRAF